MTFTSQSWSLNDLLKTVLKDKDFFDSFGGGVTVSGGEPLRHHLFVAELFKRLKQHGVHTALDTCGFATRESLAHVLPFTDHVLYDIKCMDPDLHKQYTGQSNERILENLTFLASTIRAANQDRPAALKLWIRTPLIPGATATAENIAAIARFLQDGLNDVVERWELCAFNPACRSKYHKLGQTWAYQDCDLLDQEMIDALTAEAVGIGIPREMLVVSGLVARSSGR
jgi:pyruvate formate lyase activating enzyme